MVDLHRATLFVLCLATKPEHAGLCSCFSVCASLDDATACVPGFVKEPA
jgi:hypothetical protein